MTLITRQEKGSKLSIEEMDNNLLYLEGLAENTGFTQAKIGSNTDYSQFNTDGSLTFFGAATTFNDQPVDILAEVSNTINPMKTKIFRNDGAVSENYATYLDNNTGIFSASGYTELNNSIINGTFSISFWFKVESNMAYMNHTMFSIPDSGNNTVFAFGSFIGKCSVRTILGYPHGYQETTNNLIENVWNHFAYVQDSSGGTIYLNNVPTTVSGFTITNLGGVGYFGCEKIIDLYDLVLPFHGQLSNLRFYNRKLSLEQIIELYNYGAGLSIYLQPTGIIENSNVIFDFRNLENSGVTIYNSATLGIYQDITFNVAPVFLVDHIGQSSTGIFLPVFELPLQGILGNQRSIRFEMSHNWKIGTPISLHMHISTIIPILSGQTIIFRLEKTIQDVYGVLSPNSTNIINPTKTFPVTSPIIYTFVSNIDIDAYANFILQFDNVDMSSFTSLSTCGAIMITRLYGTFPGDIYEIQSIRMHYEIDSTGSHQLYQK